ncbi:hypothetical protein Ga0100231_004545 [Opitutaceae bacterium TAV4]|nr:hypothetical protein Ga0100231_004545 [Opitutaceae bacterium TAV4]RRK02282.1 hypothetical protein Ga0100230_003710 [Opitutaceae bacterium TAV3]
MKNPPALLVIILLGILSIATNRLQAESSSAHALSQLRNQLADERGNTIPDFSRAGYRGGGVALPRVLTIGTLSPSDETGDDGARIQKIIDEIATLPANADGHRGALLLKRGVYRVAGSLYVPGGVVLRGEGSGETDATVIIATGTKRRELVILGDVEKRPPVTLVGNTPAPFGSAEIKGTRRRITDTYVPWSTHTLTLEHIDGLSVGDRVVILRPGTTEWIAGLGMDSIQEIDMYSDRKLYQWKPAEYDFPLERFINAIDVETRRVTLDAPLMIALDEQYGGGWLYRAESHRATECGVESLRLVSEYKKGKEKTDTDHATVGVTLRTVENTWIRDVVALHFNIGFVVERTAIFTTIRGSALLDPISPVRGGYRYGFSLRGQYGLVENCRTRNARHAFSTAARARGPNVFLDGVAELSHTDSGPHERFAIGTLYDNIRESKDLVVQNRGNWGTGHGWAGAQQVFWNCTVSGEIVLQRPPTAQNYAIGCIGKLAGGRFPDMPRGLIWSHNQHVQPASLYRAQLEARTLTSTHFTN